MPGVGKAKRTRVSCSGCSKKTFSSRGLCPVCTTQANIRSNFEKTKEGSFLYVVSCGEFYKIGIAWDMDSRLMTLQVGNPYELKLVFAKRHPLAKELEGLIHERLAGKKVRGEWFRLDEEDIEKIKKTVV